MKNLRPGFGILRILCAGLLVGFGFGGCNSLSEVKPAGQDTFAIMVKGYESASDTPEGLREKMTSLFQKKAQEITEGRHYDHFELVSFDVAHESQGGSSIPVARGTIRCFR